MWESLFGAVNLIGLIGWALLAFAPRTALVNSVVLYLGVALLCLIYVVCLVGVVAGGSLAGGVEMSIAGVRALFAQDAGVVIGWTHYLAFDLFTGLWIARDADNKGFGRLIQIPFLLATFLAGPVGLLTWLIMRERRARAASRRNG